jgi:hypothetical protein
MLFSFHQQRRLTNTHSDGGGGFCGTKSISLSRQLQVFEEIDDYKRRHKRRLQSAGPYTIDVHFVHFKSSSSEADFSTSDINANMDTINQYFADSPFTFRLLRVDEVVSSSFATCDRANVDLQAQMGTAHREGDATLLNVFMCTVPDPFIKAYTTYPYNYPLVVEIDNVYIDPTMIGGGKVTLAHEIGHWLGTLIFQLIPVLCLQQQVEISLLCSTFDFRNFADSNPTITTMVSTMHFLPIFLPISTLLPPIFHRFIAYL